VKCTSTGEQKVSRAKSFLNCDSLTGERFGVARRLAGEFLFVGCEPGSRSGASGSIFATKSAFGTKDIPTLFRDVCF
jgi:hypothetical protein